MTTRREIRHSLAKFGKMFYMCSCTAVPEETDELPASVEAAPPSALRRPPIVAVRPGCAANSRLEKPSSDLLNCGPWVAEVGARESLTARRGRPEWRRKGLKGLKSAPGNGDYLDDKCSGICSMRWTGRRTRQPALNGSGLSGRGKEDGSATLMRAAKEFDDFRHALRKLNERWANRFIPEDGRFIEKLSPRSIYNRARRLCFRSKGQ